MCHRTCKSGDGVCAALVLGPAAASAAAADAGREATGPGVAQTALEPGTDLATLLDRIDGIDSTRYDRALAPLLDTLPRLAAAQGTRIDPARAAAYAKALREWSNTVQERLRHLDAGATDRVHRAAPRAADPVSDLVNAIQAAVNSLLGSLTSLDLGGVLGAVTGLLAPILDAITGLLGAVPALPSVPSAGSLVSTTTVAP
ncbi:MAG: hypothetical protein JF597_16210 [Streptomyces sp.]|uniref:hypothetical protein n=1 Tax=Streptomyces sp. TaxID=1931 RepID=UPI0025EFBFC5|nr:hypothetical protein [Streptomyces sp.]MBW8795079.1 hypothetical protein [Streptomyces sp.]